MIDIKSIDDIKEYKHIHMIGIGGISMSGIAELLHHWGFTVTGSDSTNSEIIEKLIQNGIPVAIGHDFDNIYKANMVVYSAAIKQNDPELLEARKLNIPIIERKNFLGEITKVFENTICVSGTHGKTTTTSMISSCFLEADLDPTIQVGAVLKEINGNYRVGNSPNFILEACEYSESFLKFHPKTEVILNIDNDHLDYFKTFENIKDAFVKYVKLLPNDGLLILNADDPNCLELKKYVNCEIVTYSINNQKANFIAKNIEFDSNGFAHFEVYHNDSFFGTFKLSVAGNHNVLNSLACISLCHCYGIPTYYMKDALLKFTGANRRLEYKGSFRGASVFDDYGHHPTEIEATVKAISNKEFNESWVVFQPHTYSRTKTLLNEFAESLLAYDHIIITDIYAAREDNIYNISSIDLVNKIKEKGKNAIYISDFSEIVNYLKNRVQPKDIILTQGAGTVTQIGPMLIS